MNRKSTEDKKIAELFGASLPDAPGTPWFTRTVLNRLPEKQKQRAGRIEMAVCVIGIIVTVVLATRFVMQTLASPTIYVSDIIVYAIYVGIFGGLVWNIADTIRRNGQRRKGMARMQ